MLKLTEDNPMAYCTPIQIYTPYPGTELYEKSIQEGFVPPKSLSEWGNFNWNASNIGWLNKKQKDILDTLSYITFFLDGKSIRDFKTFADNPLVRSFIDLYSPISRLKCKKHWFKFAPEIKIMKKLLINQNHL